MVAGGRSRGGTAFRPTIFVSARNPVRSDARSGIGMPPVGTPSFMCPPSRSGTWVAVSATISIAANLTGCSLHDLAHRAVAHHHLQRHRERRDGERDQEAEAVEAIAASLQHPDRVDRRDDEAGARAGRRAGSEPARAGSAGLKIAAQGWTSVDLAGRVEAEAARRVHPGVRGDDRERAQRREQRQRQAEPEVHARAQAIPAEDVDRDEDRLEEEGEPSIMNGSPNTSPNRPSSPGHSSPISNDSTVPVTAPTAKVTPMTCDQRRASRSAASSRGATRTRSRSA